MGVGGGLNFRFIGQTYDGMTVLCGYVSFMLLFLLSLAKYEPLMAFYCYYQINCGVPLLLQS